MRNDRHMEIAGRIYDLDEKVYKILGSGLGRVFSNNRNHCVEDISKRMKSLSEVHIVRSELALISNMARTIPDKKVRKEIMKEYEAVLQQVKALPTSFDAVDILDEQMASLNSFNMSKRFSEENHLIICIGRTYGSAGTDIGFELADEMHMNYYDSEIFAEVLERLEAEQDHVTDYASFAHHQDLNRNLGIEQHRSFKQKLKEFNRYHGLSKEDAVFFNQSDLLCEMAKREDFIVMGRCADVILTNHRIPHISIFINAPFETRVRRVMELDNLDYKAACKLLKRLDRRHGSYYRFYTGRQWGSNVNYDLCINSASYGINGSVQLIRRIIEKHTGR